MYLWLCIVFSFFATVAYADSTTFKTKLEQGAIGDYIVTEQDKNYSFLRIRELTSSRLVLEEIVIPDTSFTHKKTSWPEWLKDGAKGHSAWIFYEIDLKRGELIECFSVSQKGWISVDQPTLPKMLSLPLSSTPIDQRRRIGPAPAKGEVDQRALWTPPLVFEGHKVHKPVLEVYETRWPDDGSELALCHLELYFLPNFALPFWLETSNGHYTLKIRTVACGKNSTSPVQFPMPHRTPLFNGSGKPVGEHFCLTLRSPSYYTQFTLFALDLTDPTHPPFSVPFECFRKEKEETILSIPLKTLKELLQTGHSYRWILSSDLDGQLYVESEEPLLW